MRLLTIILAGLGVFSFPALTTYAAPLSHAEVEECLNQQMEKRGVFRIGLDAAEKALEVQHQGATYHWIYFYKTGKEDYKTDAVLVTAEGVCEMPIVDGPGGMTKEDFDRILGVELHQKFIKAFKQQQQQN